MTEATQTNDQEDYVSPLDMSDEDFLAQDNGLPDTDVAGAEAQDATDTDDVTDPLGDEPGEGAEDEAASAAEDAGAEAGEEATTETEELGEGEGETTDPDKDKETDEAPDYKSELEKLLAPFQANGKQMKVDNVDEAIQLMQMGANYNKKMAALKPSLKTLRLLDKHGLNDESKLSYLIDLEKKNPAAIRKLVKESGLDPLEMDVESESDYEPQQYTVDDKEMALEDVLESIQDSPHYSQTVQLVSNTWDSRSQKVVAENPQLLTMINDHMASGVYGRVSEAVEKERTFGRLNGLSDLEAYDSIGKKLAEQGAFDDLFGNSDKSAETPPRKEIAPPPKKAPVDPEIKSKKRAASSTKPKPSSTPGIDDLNPLALSDEEYEKRFNNRFV